MNGRLPESAFPPAAIAEAMGHIYRRRMTTISGGNISVRDDEGAIWITPSQVDKGRLCAEDIFCVKPDGRIEGRHKPSSELPSHRQIYEARSDVRAIVHAHSPALVAFSICHKTPDTAVLPEVHYLCGEVGYAPYEPSGSEALGRRIAAVFADGHDCVMLENHGIAVGGADLDTALMRFEALELTAGTIIKANMLGDVRSPAAEQGRPGADVGDAFGQIERRALGDDEKALGRELCEFVRRIYRQRLTISGGGGFSARLSDRSFIITARGANWRLVDVEDLVRIDDRACVAIPPPDRVVLLHDAIYRQHPDVGAIITAAPPEATAFALTDAHLDSRIIPESYVFLRDVVRISGSRKEEPVRLAALVGPDRPAALVENEGALVVGTSILHAFDRLEVLNATAAAVLNSRRIGQVMPLTDGMIEGLRGGPPPGG